jgi:hypothetical protein
VNHPSWVAAPAASRTDARRAPAPAPALAAALPSEPADPLDAWLRRGLSRRFGAAAGEPVPEHLLRLVGEERARR